MNGHQDHIWQWSLKWHTWLRRDRSPQWWICPSCDWRRQASFFCITYLFSVNSKLNVTSLYSDSSKWSKNHGNLLGATGSTSSSATTSRLLEAVMSVDWRLSCSLSNWRKWRRRNPKAAMPKTPTSNGLFNSRKNCFYFSRNLGLNLAKKEVDK